MELELGLKITHNRDDITSHADLRIAKDYTGPLFLSRETESMFFLIAYLKGFRRDNIEIDINKDGNRIAISGKRAVQEMVLSGWIMRKKDVELRAFRKVFRIPDGIILDRIKAKFNDRESSLTIIMPKLVKGMCGVEIQEVKGEEELDIWPPRVTKVGPYKLPEGEHKELGKKKMEEIEEAVHKGIEKREPEMPGIAGDEVSADENDKEVPKEGIEPKTERKEESDQVKEQVGTTKEVAEIPDNGKEMMLQDKSEDSIIENKDEIGSFEEKNVVKGEFEEKQDVANTEIKPDRPLDVKLQEKPGTEGGKGSEAAAPKQVESPALTGAYEETAAVEPDEAKLKKTDEQREEKGLNAAREVTGEELPDLKEKPRKQEIPGAEIAEDKKLEEHGHVQESTELTEPVSDKVEQQPELPNLPTQLEQLQATEAMQEPNNQEPEREIQELKNPEPDKEQNHAETEQPAEQPKKEEDKEQEKKCDGIKSEIKEETANDEVKHPEEKQIEEHELPEIEKQKELMAQATKTKNAFSKGSKLRPPFVVAGSAILVSLIVLVITLIRAKRR